MAKTGKITLGGVDYQIRALNLDELQELGDLIAPLTGFKSSVAVLKYILERAADPKVENAGALQPTMGGTAGLKGGLAETYDAARTALEIAGLKEPDESP